MKRHYFVAALFAAALMPYTAAAQESNQMRRIGFLGTEPKVVEPFRDKLRQLGWIEGQNIVIEYRWARGERDRASLHAAELIRLDLSLITVTASPYAELVGQATRTIPVVFCTHGDPVGAGLVTNLARPGGNITGISNLLTVLSIKSLELLTQAIPGAKHIAVLWNPTSPPHRTAVPAVEAAAQSLGVELRLVPARTTEEFEAAFAAMTRERTDAVLGLLSPLHFLHRARLAELSLEHRLPTVFGAPEHAEAGALLSYGPVLSEMFRRCATLVDKILKGANPAELPVEQPSTYPLVINLKTARALGLEIPQAVLARADELIE
jgi:putative ABC transport system substrate-binding protein